MRDITTVGFLSEIFGMWPFKKKDDEKDIPLFYRAGGRPTWKEWEEWTDYEKKMALETAEQIRTIETLVFRFSLSSSLEEKLAIAEEMAQFDGGELAREIRRQINAMELKKINEHTTTLKAD